MSVTTKAMRTATRYVGQAAREYEARRRASAKWAAEDHAVREWLITLPAGTALLDVPCGTGRFFPAYVDAGVTALGMDISEDMLRETKGKGVPTERGTIFAIDCSRAFFDVALCVRFLNLIEAPDVARALSELQRVARREVAVTLRVHQPDPSGHYHTPHGIEVVESALAPGWSIYRSEPLHQPDYRWIVLCAG